MPLGTTLRVSEPRHTCRKSNLSGPEPARKTVFKSLRSLEQWIEGTDTGGTNEVYADVTFCLLPSETTTIEHIGYTIVRLSILFSLLPR
jgi:hypothetical protein